MKKFLISNSKFIGEVEVVYNSQNLIQSIDFSSTNLTDTQRQLFKVQIPILWGHLTTAFSSATTIVEASYECTFEDFYKSYPTKRNRYKAETAFAKLTKIQKVQATQSLQAYKKYLNRNSWITPMIADSYITRREYETDWNKEK
jgi:hypothetical protein